MRIAAATCVAFAIAIAAAAADLDLRVESHGEIEQREVMVALIPGGENLETRTLRVKLDSPSRIELPDGVWHVEVRDRHLWHQRQALFATGRAEVTVPVWPRGTISGRLAAGRGRRGLLRSSR